MGMPEDNTPLLAHGTRDKMSPGEEHDSLKWGDASDENKINHLFNGLLLRVPWLARRSWVIVLVTVLVTLIAAALTIGKPVTYSANAILLVSPGASATSPGSAAEAQGLAITYSGLIPKDSAILHSVASVMKLTKADVQNDLSVTVVNGTSLLDIQFTANSPRGALTGASTVAAAITGTPPASRAIPSGTVSTTDPPTSTTRHATKSLLVILVGLVLGFLLGIIAMIVWERADPRFDRAGQITGALNIPARSLRGLSEISSESLIERWRVLSKHHPARIALVAGVPGITGAVIELSHRLAQTSPLNTTFEVAIDSRVAMSSSPAPGLPIIDPNFDSKLRLKDANQHVEPSSISDLVFLPSGNPGTESGEVVAQNADLAVLVVPRGARVREVREAFVLLRQIGVRPKWALLVDTKSRPSPRGLVRQSVRPTSSYTVSPEIEETTSVVSVDAEE